MPSCHHRLLGAFFEVKTKALPSVCGTSWRRAPFPAPCLSSSSMPNSRVFLDIDLDSHRAKYERARAFVEACDLRYGFSSKDITMLGGGEKQRIRECYGVGGNAASPGCCVEVHRYHTAAVAALRVAAVLGRARRPLSVCPHPILATHQCTRAAQVAAAAALLIAASRASHQGLTLVHVGAQLEQLQDTLMG